MPSRWNYCRLSVTGFRALGFAAQVLIACATCFGGAVIAAAQHQAGVTSGGRDTVVVLPFENKSNHASDFNWIGESFPLLLSDLLGSTGLRVIEPAERRLVYDRLGFPRTTVLARASALRIAERVGARLLVIGSYEISGGKGQEKISVLARMINVEEGRLVGNEINAGGALADLPELQGTICWDLLFQRDSSLPMSRQDLTKRATAVSFAAFEYYVKAKLVNDPKLKVQLLTLAIKEHEKSKREGEFTAAFFELGRAHYQSGDYHEAFRWLQRVRSDSNLHVEASFYLGVACYQNGDVASAVTFYQRLAETAPSAEVYNNLATFELKNNQHEQSLAHYSRAVGLAPEDADIRFNYGHAFWRSGDFENAVIQLRQAVRRRTSDGEAHYLLGKSLERLGRADEAQVSLAQARRYLTKYAEWEKAERPPVAGRVRLSFPRAVYGTRTQPSVAATETASNREPTRNQLAEAEKLVDSNREDDALELLEAFLRTHPDAPAAHLLMGRIYQKKGNARLALDSLRAAVFWDPRYVPAHLQLARLYVALGDHVQARSSLDQALRLEPDNPEAVALAKVLESSAKKP